MDQKLNSSFFLRLLNGDINPFRSWSVYVCESGLVVQKKSWFFSQTVNLDFDEIIEISSYEHFFGATIRIIVLESDSIEIGGMTKFRASQIQTAFRKVGVDSNESSTRIKALHIEELLTADEYRRIVEKK